MVEGLQADADVMELERHFIAAVPPQGSIGNGALRIKLGWREDLYWQIRTRLLAAGILVKGRGRGGSVLRTTAYISSDAERQIGGISRITEKELYGPIASTIT